MAPAHSFTTRVASALRFDAALYEEVERDPHAARHAAGIVLLAGAGRGVSPMFEAGWMPILGHAAAGLVIWLVVSGLVWNVAHRLLGYDEGVREFARVLGFAGAPLIGLWVGVLPIPGFASVLSVAIHLVAMASLILAIRSSLQVSLASAIGVCALALLTAFLVLLLLGVFLVGTPAFGDLPRASHLSVGLARSWPDLEVAARPWI